MPPIPPSSSKAQSSADTELLVPFQPKSTCACAAAEDHNQTIPNIYLPVQWTSWFKGRTFTSQGTGRDPLWWQSGILQTQY